MRKILFASLASLGILLIIVWLTPISFTACARDSGWCRFSFWVTESAGAYGTLAIIGLAGAFYSLRFETIRQKAFNFFKCILGMSVLLAAFAWVNEHVTKKATRLPRPAHEFVFEHSKVTIPIDSLYLLEEKEREAMLEKMIADIPAVFASFDPRVLEHWVKESGYSFPSGHSFNAFLLAVVLSFGLINSRRKFVAYLWFLPLLWAPVVAISRVSLGAHSALDVSFGAAMGVLFGCLFLYFDNTRKLVVHRKPD